MMPNDRTAPADSSQIIADLQRERDEALARETAIAEVLGVINSSVGDLTPVFQVILEKAHSLCGATFGGLLTYDGNRFQAVALHGVPEAFAKIARQPFPPTPSNPVSRLLEGEPFVQVADLSEILDAAPDDVMARAGVDLGGIRTLLMVALRKQGTLLGAVTAYRQEARPFTDRQIALLQNFAAQAVIAIENTQLITETREALEQQTATAEVLGVINSSPGDLAPVFDAMLEKAMRLCEADIGMMWTFHGDSAHVSASRDVPDAFSDFLQREPPDIGPKTFFGRAITQRTIIHTADMMTEEPYFRGARLARAGVELAGIRALLMAPLVKDNAVIGVFSIFRREPRPFSDKQIALLQNFAAQAVIAMENARLITETREALEQQTATAEVLGVINASPGDLTPVFDAILEKARTLCGAAFGALFLCEPEQHFRAVAMKGGTEAWHDRIRSGFPGSEAPASAPLLAGERFVHIIDMAQVDHPMARTVVEAVGVRTSLSVPLRKDDVISGMIIASRSEVLPFTDKQIALLENFAAQAVIAMENARLITETREALEQQTASAEVLGVINSSPGDLAPVFDAMLDKAMRLCEADIGNFWTYDGEGFTPAVMRGARKEHVEWAMQRPRRGGPGSISAQLSEGDNLIHIPDAADTDAYRAGDPTRRAMVDLNGGRTLLAVALRKNEQLLGYIIVYRREVRPFTDKQIALLQNFAAQAVIAMENARLITETREALEQQTATAEVLGVINSSPGDLTPVFDAILEKAHSLCGVAQGSLELYDGERFRAVAVRGLSDTFADVLRQGSPASDNPATRPLIEGERFSYIPDMTAADYSVERTAAETEGVRTLLCVPLRREGQLLGMIASARKEARPFSEKEIALLENFAAQAVIAMENARLITETREALDQQTATAEVLQVINSSPGDLTPVFDAMLEKAMRLCEAETAHLLRYENEVFSRIASRGVSEDFDKILPLNTPVPHIITRDSIPYRMVATRAVVHVHDSREDESVRAGAPDQTAAAASGIRTALFVPLLKEGDVVGGFVMHRMEVRPFADKQIALLQNFAEQAVIAMENARLLGELRERTEEVAELNRGLEARIAEQVDELGRVGRLKRFLAPQLAEMIVSQGDEKILESHRREIVVVFCDLRGYTAFTETAEPEEVLEFLREYHGALGPLVSRFEGTLDQFSGDGIMVFFNDPVPIPDPAERAVSMAVAMRSAANALIADWRERGRDLGFGSGIAQGYATLGQIGFSERAGYTAIGTVCNVAARLCAEAKDGQILLSQRVNVALKGSVATEQLGPLALKGLTQPVMAYNVPLAAIQPAFRVIEGGPQSV